MNLLQKFGLVGGYQDHKVNSDGSFTCRFIDIVDNTELYEKFDEENYEGFLKWLNGELLIQNAMPNLSDSQRELFLTGFNYSKQKEIFSE